MTKTTMGRSWRTATFLIVALFGAVEVRAQAMPDLIFNANAINPFLSTETFAPSHCAVQEGCVVAGTRRLLRFPQRIVEHRLGRHRARQSG